MELLKKHKGKIFLGVVFVLALWVRLWWIINMPTVQMYDFSTYYDIANNIFYGAGYTFNGEPIAFQGMMYSFLLGTYFKIVGTNTEFAAKFLNVAMSMGTLVAVYFIINKLTDKKMVRNLTVIFAAFLPNHIAYTNALGTEVMMAFFLSFIVLVQLLDFNKKVKYPLLGVMIGFAALTKPFFMAYPIVAAIIKWCQEKDWKDVLIFCLVLFIGMWAVIAPWTIRNYKAFGRVIPVSYNSGYVLYLNNNANNVHGGWMSHDDIYKTPEFEEEMNRHLEYGEKSVKVASDIELLFKDEAMGWIKANPMEFIKLGLIRLHSTFFTGTWDIEAWTMNSLRETQTRFTDVEYARFMNAFRAVSDMILLTLSSFTFVYIIMNVKRITMSVFSRKRRVSPHIVVPILNISFFIAVFFVYEGQPRYNFPLLFLMIISTMLMVGHLSDAFKAADEALEDNQEALN